MTIKCKLLAKREEVGGYIVYVFQNLDDNSYLMCTRLPNWETPFLELGDIGFLEFKEVIAGVDQWYSRSDQQHYYYKYTGIYFLNFVEYKEKIKYSGIKID